jgi:maleylacetoacetate isomerase
VELYSFFQSSTSYRVRIALNLKGLVPEMHYVDLGIGEQKSDAYAKLNPARIVPTLIDGKATLSQSLAIMEYLDEAYPNTYELLPGDAVARAHIRGLSLAIAADISPLGNLKVRKYLQNELSQSEETTIEFIKHWIKEGFDVLETILAASPLTGKFCVGDTPTMADCCLIPQLFGARRWKLDLASYPAILRIEKACEALPAFAAAHPSQQADAK